MSEILFQYQKVNPTTWVYLSSLLMLGLYFQFNRFWSVRNLDLILLILLAPGLLMVNRAREESGGQLAAAAFAAPPLESPAAQVEPPPPPASPSEQLAAAGDVGLTLPAVSPRQKAYIGYLWLFGVSLVWLVRMFVDPMLIRRPLLEPNATKGCLLFLGCSLFIFLMANVLRAIRRPTT
jgi:hypothetical protein